MVKRFSRIVISQAALTKAASIGLRSYPNIGMAALLKKLCRASVPLGRRMGDTRQHGFGSFILLIEENVLVDVRVVKPDWCLSCLGSGALLSPEGTAEYTPCDNC